MPESIFDIEGYLGVKIPNIVNHSIGLAMKPSMGNVWYKKFSMLAGW